MSGIPNSGTSRMLLSQQGLNMISNPKSNSNGKKIVARTVVKRKVVPVVIKKTVKSPVSNKSTNSTPKVTNREYTSTLDIPRESKTYYTPVYGPANEDGTINPIRVGDNRMVETGPTTESLGQAINQSQQAQLTVPQEEYNPYGYRLPSVIRGQFGQIAVNPDTGQAVFGGAFNRRQGRAMHNLGLNYVDNLGNEWDMGRLNRRDIRFMRRSMNRTGRRIANEINNLQGAYETLYGSLAGGPGWSNFFEQWRQNKANNMIDAGKQLAADSGYAQQTPQQNTSANPTFDAYLDWSKNNQGSYFDYYKSNMNQNGVGLTTPANTKTDAQKLIEQQTYGYYQQGGKMNDKQLQEAFIQFLAQKSGAKNEKELEEYVKQLGEDGLKQAYAEFTEVMQKQTQKAKQGAKLNYIKQLKHQCPEGQEPYYYKKGGMVNCGCKGVKMEDGGKSPKTKKQSAVEKFRARNNQQNNQQNNQNLRGDWQSQKAKEQQRKNREEAAKGEGESPVTDKNFNKGYKKNEKGGKVSKAGAGCIFKPKFVKKGSKVKMGCK